MTTDRIGLVAGNGYGSHDNYWQWNNGITFQDSVNRSGYSQIVQNDMVVIEKENARHYKYMLAMPGMKMDDITAYIRDEKLIVEYKVDEYYKSFYSSQRTQTFSLLGKSYEPEFISAMLRDGILSIELKKKNPDIEIKLK